MPFIESILTPYICFILYVLTLMTNLFEIKQLAWQRLEEAKILSSNNMCDGAFYLAGYSVELMLKAKICERLGIPNLFAESDSYAKKHWTNHERKAAQAKAFKQNEEYILPLRLDETEIPGLYETVGYINYKTTGLTNTINLLIEKLS